MKKLNSENENCFVDSKKGIKRKLNLNYTKWSNMTYPVGDRDMLMMTSPKRVNIDYLALYSKPSEYRMTEHTAVCFFEYDNVFDGKNGLWNAIYYGDGKLLNKFKERFKGVKYFIMPDYSQFGDGLDTMNAYNANRARIVATWLSVECDAICIPLITYANEKSFEYIFDGLESCEVVSFSLKGSLIKENQLDLLEKAIDLTLERLPLLKQIIVYSVSSNDSRVYGIFQKAADKNIEILIPNNLLKERNAALKKAKTAN